MKPREILDRASAYFRNLSTRERVLVGTAGTCVLAALLYVAVALPLLSARSALADRAGAAEQQLEAVRRLRRDFDEVHQRLASVEARIQGGQRGNLRTTLETLARNAGLDIKSMEPQASPQNARYRETKVELGLEGVSLEQAVRYLHEIEANPGQVLSVKSLRLRKRPDRGELLDVTFTVSAFEPV